jgi:hypothetical protein
MHVLSNSIDGIAVICNYGCMTKVDQITKLRRAWVTKIGRSEATARLIQRGFSVSTADKICADKYGAELRTIYAAALLDEMAKDGFKLAGEKAS